MSNAEVTSKVVSTVTLINGDAFLPVSDTDVHQKQWYPQVLVKRLRCKQSL